MNSTFLAWGSFLLVAASVHRLETNLFLSSFGVGDEKGHLNLHTIALSTVFPTTSTLGPPSEALTATWSDPVTHNSHSLQKHLLAAAAAVRMRTRTRRGGPP